MKAQIVEKVIAAVLSVNNENKILDSNRKHTSLYNVCNSCNSVYSVVGGILLFHFSGKFPPKLVTRGFLKKKTYTDANMIVSFRDITSFRFFV